jgi:molybdopterin-containing oxidoreductase family membrane subunit
MKELAMELLVFTRGMFNVLFRGGKLFYAWMLVLTLLVLVGAVSYFRILADGYVVTHLRDQVPWGFLIANFTFLVGIAAAAVLLIIPAYLYGFKPIKEIVAFGELLAVTAIVMSLAFIMVHLGRIDRFWHVLPGIGYLNWPVSLLSWDMLALNAYMALSLFIALYIGGNRYFGKEPNVRVVVPLVLISIPLAISVHALTAFIYNGFAARPFWNASILTPRFLASAFCSGPALLILIFQTLRRLSDFRIEDSAIRRLAEIIAYAMAINLFLAGAEVFKEYYSRTDHLTSMKYLFQGLEGHRNLVAWTWAALAFNIIGFVIFLVPRLRNRTAVLNLGCVLVFIGVWVEKGMGLIFPGFIPNSLGEVYEYMPSDVEIGITVAIWAMGAMMYTLFVRAAIAIDSGRFRRS